jgi:hypothetical protein
MIIGLLVVAILLLIAGFLTPVGSGTTLLLSAILSVVALVLSLKRSRKI